MTKFKLGSPRQAEDALGRLFLDGDSVTVSVREDKAFVANEWLELGQIALFSLEKDRTQLKSAVRAGSFEWRVPERAVVADRLRTLLRFSAITDAKKKQVAEDRLAGVLQSMAGIAVRTGLSWPRFDPKMVSEMPFRRPATVIADTSGVVQGALGFVADYLYPTARLKIPAILHMEVINQADRFMKTWRSDNVRGEALLYEHVRSQPGQRALVRLELRDDTEVERNLLLSDPLRNAFKEDKDSDLRELNLSVPLKSYVDRMILEVARTHQSTSSPGHEVYLLTADQGLAKMALAEGVTPLFFQALHPDQIFGKILTGTRLHPFTGRLVSRTLPHVLWELATAFGRVKLARDGNDYIEIAAIGKDLSWSSYHSVDDLLWFKSSNLPEWPAKPDGAGVVSSSDDVLIDEIEAVKDDAGGAEPAAPRARSTKSRLRGLPRNGTASSDRQARLATTNKAGVAFYRLTANGLVKLIDQIAVAGPLSDEHVADAIGVRGPTAIAEYRRFLLSGGFIHSDRADWAPTDSLFALATAQRERDIRRMRELLSSAPSYRRFIELLAASKDQTPVVLEMPPRVIPTYIALGEVTGIGVDIVGEGFYPTLFWPSLRDFSDRALARYEQLDPADNWVSVGEWLEALVRKDGIHPIVARELLQEADAANLLRRSTEGSTTNTRQDSHSLRVLQVQDGKVGVETVHLYRGDFLIPGKSSSSLRLQRAS